MKNLYRVSETTLLYDTWTESMAMAKMDGTIYTEEELLNLMEQCLAFYQHYSEQDVNRKNQQILERRNNRVYSVPRTPPKKGYVYFIQAENGLTKIGETGNLRTRYKAIKDNMVLDVKFLFAIKSNDVRKLETELHKRLEAHKEKGEWFNLSKKTLINLEESFKEQSYELSYIK